MSTAEEQRKEPNTLTPVRVGWTIYQQVTAVIGSFAILAFVTNFVHFDWRGWLETLIGMWDQFVRPPVHWLLHYLAEVPLGWLGWQIEVPQWLRDYLAVGFVLVASTARMEIRSQGWRGAVDSARGIVTPIYVLAWPFVIIADVVEMVGDVRYLWLMRRIPVNEGLGSVLSEEDDRDQAVITRNAIVSTATVMSPLAYAGLLLAMNYLVLR